MGRARDRRGLGAAILCGVLLLVVEALLLGRRERSARVTPAAFSFATAAADSSGVKSAVAWVVIRWLPDGGSDSSATGRSRSRNCRTYIRTGCGLPVSITGRSVSVGLGR